MAVEHYEWGSTPDRELARLRERDRAFTKLLSEIMDTAPVAPADTIDWKLWYEGIQSKIRRLAGEVS